MGHRSKDLVAAMRERPLTKPSAQHRASAPNETYRFLWVRSFHHPVAVRVERRNDEYLLVAKELDGEGGWAPGKLILNKSRALTGEEWSALTRQIKACDFWTLPVEEDQSFVDDSGRTIVWAMNDGAAWIMEGTRGDEYHLVVRQCPEDDPRRHRKLGNYRAACLHMLTLAGFEVDGKDVY